MNAKQINEMRVQMGLAPMQFASNTAKKKRQADNAARRAQENREMKTRRSKAK